MLSSFREKQFVLDISSNLLSTLQRWIQGVKHHLISKIA